MDRTTLATLLFERMKDQLDPRVKHTVARRVAQKVALAVLRNPASAWGPVHHSAMALATEAESLPVEKLHKFWEEVCGVLLVGQVVPRPDVHRFIDEASDWHLGMCICRQAERVRDLHAPDTGKVLLAGEAEQVQPHLLRLLDTWKALGASDKITDMDAGFLLDRFERDRARGELDVGAFFEATWPRFEILLEHPEYTDAWQKTMARNRRTWRVHPELLKAWADLLYFGRGVVFTAMTMVDARYTICSCPGPEVDGGCILFNWHFFSGNPYVITENKAGQRRNAKGPLPCARHPERADKPCFGCGCNHEHPELEVPDGLPDPRAPYIKE